MTDPADHDPLLSGILDDSVGREQSLSLGLEEFRRARRRRSGKRRVAMAATSLAIVGAALLLSGNSGRLGKNVAAIQPTPGAGAARVEIISDDQLLDLFPGRAVALVGPAANRRLIFLSDTR